jgi:putative tryptophan/tyrosine transport system substrate-binding protein
MTVTIGRRELLAALGGAAATWPLAARAQQGERMRTVGVLMGLADDAEAEGRLMAFEHGLETEGWSLGQNLRIEYRLPKAILRACRLWRRSWWSSSPTASLATARPL